MRMCCLTYSTSSKGNLEPTTRGDPDVKQPFLRTPMSLVITRVVLHGNRVFSLAVGIRLLPNWGYCIATRRAGKKFRIESI